MPRPRFRAPLSRLAFARHRLRLLARYARIRARGLVSLASPSAARGYRRARSHPSVLVAAATALILVISLVVVGALPDRRRAADRAAGQPAGAPADTSQPGGKPVQPKVGELPERSTAMSTTRRNQNGSFTTTVYSSPVNYRDKDGSYKPIDSRLHPDSTDGYAWRSGANRFQARFKQKLEADFTEFRVRDRVFRTTAVGAGQAAAKVSGSQVSYPGAYSGADLTYTVGKTGVKEVIHLAGPDSPTSYTFRISAADKGSAPSVRKRADGSYWVMASPLPGPAFVISAPLVREASARERQLEPPAREAKPAMTVQRIGRDLVVTLSLDEDWLRAPGRRFPVELDPTMTVQPDVEDASFITQVNDYPWGDERLYIGSDEQYTFRSALQFDLSSVPAGTQLTDARLGLYWDYWCMDPDGRCMSSDHVMDAHRMTAVWSTSSTTNSLRFDATAAGTYTLPAGAGQGWMTWPITSTAQGWLSGSIPNYGLLVKRRTEVLNSSGPNPPGRRFTGEPTLQPKLELTYSGDGVDLLEPETVHGNGADLAWTRYTGASGAPFVKYEVHRSRNATFAPSAQTLLTTIGDPSVTAYRDTTAAPEQAFTYRIVANSSISNPRTVTLPAAGQARKVLQPDPAAGRETTLNYSTQRAVCENNGVSDEGLIGTSATDKWREAFYFDLRDIPANATISSATASAWQRAGATAPMAVEAHRITRPWKEGTGWAYCMGDGATWYETEGGQAWSTPGGDVDDIIAATATAPAGDATGFLTLEIKDLVQSWVNGTSPNNGFLLKASDEALRDGNWALFATDDYAGTSALRPKLTVTYADGNETQKPRVSLAAPAPGSTVSGASVRLAASAEDDGRVDLVEFLVNGSVVASDGSAPFETTWNSTTVVNGTRDVTVRATDDAGNISTSAVVSVRVDNTAAPTGSLTAPAAGATVSGSAVTLSASASDDVGVASVAFLVDGVRVGVPDTTSPYSIAWNTLDPLAQAFNGSHQITAAVTDTSGQVTVTAARTVTVNNTGSTSLKAGFALNDPATTADDVFPQAMTENTAAGVPVQDPSAGTTNPDGTSGGSLNRALGSAPQDDGGTPSATCPTNAYCPSVTVTNTSGSTWSSSTRQVWYRWYAPNGAVMFEGKSATAFPATFTAGATQKFPLTIYPPALPPGVQEGTYRLRVDIWDPATATWFSAKGNPPVDHPVLVAKSLATKLGLERYYQYDGEPAGAGMSTLTNVANGNMLTRCTPFFSPGRGLSTMLDLTYNSLEDHSRSPAGSNFSLSISGLTRLGKPLDIHPNKADEISGRSNKWVEFTDGDGTTHRFDGTTGTDGITRWTEPPGVNLYLRSLPDGDPNGKWALTRPDKVTFYFDADGFPLSVQDRNNNRITFTLEDTPPGEDPGGPKKRITKVTDASGRAFLIDYWSKDEIKKAHVRGNIQTITDHSGSKLDFDYYDDGNLLRLTQRGGTNADGTFLADRSFVFTYTTSNGAGPAISDPALRVNPEPRTPNQSTRLFSIRDPRGNETTYAYYQANDGAHLKWKLKSRTNRDGQTTGYGYDLTNRVTTVTAPLSRVTKYSYDTTGKVTSIVNPKNETTGVQWSADFKVTKVTEPTGKFSEYSYNANGYPLTQTNQAGEKTELTYTDQAVDANDTGKHLSLLATVTTPKGVATTTVSGDYQWKYSYDAAGNPDKITDPTGAVTDYNYNLAGSTNPGTVAQVTDANGNTPTVFEAYHASGQPTAIRDPLGKRTRVDYNNDGQARWIQDPNHENHTGADERAYRAFFDYDSFGRLGRQSAPKSTSTERGTLLWSGVEYDANDNVTRQMDAHYGSVTGGDPNNGAVTITAYDTMDRPTRVTDPEGSATRIDYDGAGRTEKVTKPKGVASSTTDDYATVFGYDPLDRIVRQTAYGTSTSQDRVTQFCYDLAGDLRSVTSPRAGTATITCPGNGPAVASYTSETDYDAAHRPTVQRDELGHGTRTSYDANGNVTTTESDITTGRVTRTEVDYDQRDMPVTVRERFDGTRNVTTVIGYDKNGNRTKVVSPRAFDTANGGTATYYVTVNHYDGLNRLTRVDLPFNAGDDKTNDGISNPERQYVHHAYDANGNLAWTSLPVTTATAGSVGATAKTVMEYFDPGWIRTSDDPANPKAHFDYTAQGWQAKRQVEKRSSPGTLDDKDQMFWTYYLDGQLKNRTDREGQINRYEYDAHKNLTKAFDNGLSSPDEKEVETQATYTGFDEADKVRHRKQGSTAWTFTAYDYDDNGNVILREENGEENDAGTESKAPRRIELSYDGADWLTQQLDLGTDGACKDDTRTVNTWWGTGWEKQRDVHRAGASCTTTATTWPKKQTTTWTHFDNGKLKVLETRAFKLDGTSWVTEKHDVGYFDANGDYVNGNRTSDRYVLVRAAGNTATTCLAASPCDAKYTYDARDRLLTHQLRTGRTDTYTFDEPTKLIGDTSIRAGNVTTEVKNGTTTSKRYTSDQLTDITVGGVTGKYWYDDWGNLDCLTLAAGSKANCSPSDGSAASSNLITDYGYDYLNRLTNLRHYGSGTRTDKTTYTYDALDRTTKEVEDHTGTGTDRTTAFTYQGLTSLATEERQTGGTDPRTKTFSYDAYGHRIAMTDKATGSTTEPNKYTYGVDVHSSVSQLIDDAGSVRASYGYNAYGGADSPSSDPQSLTTGDTGANPINPYRYSGKRIDTGTTSTTPSPVPNGSGGYDMGARRYGPDTASFLQQDMYHGSLANLGLALDPLTQNRYALAGGNPISYIETDGHMVTADGGGGGSTSTNPSGSTSGSASGGTSGGPTPQPQPGHSPTAPTRPAPPPPPCSGVSLNSGCFTGPQLRQGNIDNGSTQFAINRAMSQGGKCEPGARQIICTESWGYAVNKGDDKHWPQAQTIGDVMLYPGTKDELQRNLASEARQRAQVAGRCDKYGTCLDPNVFGRDLLGHEAAHSDQWQHYGRSSSPMPDNAWDFDFGRAYIAEQAHSAILCPDGGIGACNKFEIGANPFKGGYWDPPQVVNGVFAPGDNWPDRIKAQAGW